MIVLFLLFTHLILLLGNLKRVIWQVDKQIQMWVIKVSLHMKGCHEVEESKLQFLDFLELRAKLKSY